MHMTNNYLCWKEYFNCIFMPKKSVTFFLSFCNTLYIHQTQKEQLKYIIFRRAKLKAKITDLTSWNTQYSAISVLRLLSYLDNQDSSFKYVILGMEVKMNVLSKSSTDSSWMNPRILTNKRSGNWKNAHLQFDGGPWPRKKKSPNGDLENAANFHCWLYTESNNILEGKGLSYFIILFVVLHLYCEILLGSCNILLIIPPKEKCV